MQRYNPFQDSVIIFPEVTRNSPSPYQATAKKQKLYADILSGTNPAEIGSRSESIMLANASQEEALRKNNVAISNTDEAYHRKLVAYYRPTQLEYISRVQICEIMRFLKYYVEQGYSRIFDEFLVMYRFPDRDIMEEFAVNSHLATGVDFRVLSSIYANTIHFSDGTPDFIPGTIPILGTTPYNRWKNKRLDSIHMPLEYRSVEKVGHKHGIVTEPEKRKGESLLVNSNLQPVLNLVLERIKAVESAMIGG